MSISIIHTNKYISVSIKAYIGISRRLVCKEQKNCPGLPQFLLCFCPHFSYIWFYPQIRFASSWIHGSSPQHGWRVTACQSYSFRISPHNLRVHPRPPLAELDLDLGPIAATRMFSGDKACYDLFQHWHNEHLYLKSWTTMFQATRIIVRLSYQSAYQLF